MCKIEEVIYIDCNIWLLDIPEVICIKMNIVRWEVRAPEINHRNLNIEPLLCVLSNDAPDVYAKLSLIQVCSNVWTYFQVIEIGNVPFRRCAHFIELFLMLADKIGEKSKL